MLVVALVALTQAGNLDETRTKRVLATLREQRELGRVGLSAAPEGRMAGELVGDSKLAKAYALESCSKVLDLLTAVMGEPANDIKGLRTKVDTLLASVNALRGNVDAGDLPARCAEAVLMSGQHRWVRTAAFASLFGFHLYYSLDPTRKDGRSTLLAIPEHEPGLDLGAPCCPIRAKIVDGPAVARVLSWMLRRKDSELDLELYALIAEGHWPLAPELLEPLYEWLTTQDPRPLARYAALALSKYGNARAHELLISAAYEFRLGDSRLLETLRGILANGRADAKLSNLVVILEGRLSGVEGNGVPEDHRARLRGALEDIRSRLRVQDAPKK